MSEIRWRCTIQAAVDEDSETELNSLWNSKPVEITEKWRHMLTYPGRVDESSSCIENRLESIQLPHIKTGHRRTAVVDRVGVRAATKTGVLVD